MNKVLVIGACGQLGTELTLKLRDLFGVDNVIASDLRDPAELIADGPYERLDVMDKESLDLIIDQYQITEIYHLAAILSAKGEQAPKMAWDLNMNSLLNVLEAGRKGVKKIYWPSSIAVFGPDTPSNQTPQHTVMNPNTVYGISKLAGERWCEYYHQKYGVDVRSLRYPGLIGYKAQPGGGTTDYAVDIFWKAIMDGSYECFLRADAKLPMMYMDDAVKATVELMQADADKVTVRSSYNVSAMSFSPEMIYEAICKRYPDFKITYTPDFRQEIADSWPNSIDDSQARKDWGWQHDFDLDQLVGTMLDNLEAILVSAK
ncbi:NAD-dependent epimerase/dehydratase family protein [Marinoscillum furvescens]|uniref:Nucleoside-diphosphate-sugar epimerase n=1 Tax=Marinoscillum furvescens DSM 4134 TaxID=1122208 RepID=A0A3D9LJK6_MARFU|nr:NAD-dependent epimerase/dehydratase family protein [Marinoscillum furvescens]REE05993.1 nucleoside-diphosphate-sugar epimerase [Marinoscillum furvescens DSM 4134]